MIFMQILPFLIAFSFIVPSYSAPTNLADNAVCTLRDYVPHFAYLKDEKRLQELEQFARKYADEIEFHHERTKNWVGEPIAPFTLLPSKFPRRSFDMAMELQPSLNLLYWRASFDYEFLSEVFGEVAKTDAAVRQMLEIIRDAVNEGAYQRQGISMNWMRADYMLHMEDDAQAEGNNDQFELKQIEVNAGAAGGIPMCRRMTVIHRHILEHLGMDASPEVLRPNTPLDMMVEALLLAWHKFGDPDAVVLAFTRTRSKMPGAESTIQALFDLHTDGKLKMEYVPYADCDDELVLDPKDFSLRMKDGRKVAIADYRNAPFPPVIKTTDKLIRCLRKVEFSTAIKHPTLGFHLMNLKKAQQYLAKPGMVERFFTKPEEAHYAKAIRQTFAGLWGLDSEDEETKAIIEDAMEHPDRYVLKPMKEGGGNNFYGEDVAKKLKELTPEQRGTFILQQRINPPTYQNYIVEPFATERQDPNPRLGTMIAELSIWAMFVGDGHKGTVLYNHGHGYMVRAKWADDNEGGILNGRGFYDNPYLY